MQKAHKFMGKIDPVVKWADKKNLTPSFLYEPDKPAPDIVRPVTEAGKARARLGQGPVPDESGPRRRRASAILAKRGLLGG